ncbi:MAG TPA: glycosyl hydrolase [Kiritimatiellia bacterium]|nr:glycosyl hydrolase [Kiritimatiellia bacterium]HRU69853.1 glycosyl hydrolase [Kiritimatiellia bacterium]
MAVCATATELDDQFRNPPQNMTRVCVALAVRPGAAEGEWLDRQLERVRDVGAGGVLLTVPTVDEAMWQSLERALERARLLGLDVGFRDFCVTKEDEEKVPRARKLVWSCEATQADASDGRETAPQVAVPSSSSYRLIADLAVPDGAAEIQPHQLVDLSNAALPTNGAWRICRFGSVELEPPRVDPFAGTAFFRHVNQWLFAAQSRFARTYGSTLLWVQFSGHPQTEFAWPSDMPEAFLKLSGLNLLRHLPALAGVPVGSESTAAFVRQQAVRTVRALWRERCGKTVDELVHEAGLEAAVRIDEVPVEPVEVAWRFRRPILVASGQEAAREANRRAAGGARTMGRRFVMGELTPLDGESSPAAVLLAFPWKPALDRLLADGATRILLDVGGSLPSDDGVFRQLREGCRYAHRCQVMLQQGAPAGDVLVWSERPVPALAAYSCDTANEVMLEAAAVKDGRIRFDSEREYTGLVVSPEILRRPGAERLVRMIASRGVRVWLMAGRDETETSAHARFADAANTVWVPEGVRGLPGLPPDCVWQTDTSGMQVSFVHRRTAAHEVYYLVNESTEPGSVSCTFRDTGKKAPERWDPATGEIELLKTDVALEPDGRVTAKVFLGAHDACFIVFDR